MTALARYVIARCLTSQRWVPPITLFVLASAVFFTAGGDATGAGSISALLLVPTTTWMTISALHVDDPSQVAVVGTKVGSMLRARVGTLATVLSSALVLAVLSGVGAVTTDPHHGGVDGIAGTAAGLLLIDVMCVCSGVVLGQLCARPLVRRAGFSWSLAALGNVALVAVPGSPLVVVLRALSAHGPARSWATMVLLSGILLGVEAAVFMITLLAVRRRAA